MLFGLLNLSFWGYVIATLVLCQITIAGVTIYLHRHQTHRALDLHPIVSHFFRFWLWMTTGMVTAEWVAIHRKHHASTDVEGDPHSPKVEGLGKVFWQGAELYRKASKDRAMISKYSHGTPNDWIEKNLYSRFSAMGIVLMLLINLVLFGVPGITIWAIQMMWIPIHAAGVVNGIGHYFGYRNYECQDAATNIIPWGFWIGGEELHNNHHTYASSAKFSLKWWEFDLGWMYICILSFFGLAKVKKLPPKLAMDEGKLQVDLDTVRAVVANRFVIMARYYKSVIRPLIHMEKRQSQDDKRSQHSLRGAGRLLRCQEKLLTKRARSRLQHVLLSYEQLRLAYDFKQSLQSVWLKASSSQKDLVDALQHWCKQAEQSGLEVLQDFARQVRSYTPG
ncbi:MAG: fatty acid desaturase [Legionellaceae bacterium]|nr:fatty acid desaturase [Legionellaceae bacterium]